MFYLFLSHSRIKTSQAFYFSSLREKNLRTFGSLTLASDSNLVSMGCPGLGLILTRLIYIKNNFITCKRRFGSPSGEPNVRPALRAEYQTQRNPFTLLADLVPRIGSQNSGETAAASSRRLPFCSTFIKSRNSGETAT
jgi:hypothetical protein